MKKDWISRKRHSLLLWGIYNSSYFNYIFKEPLSIIATLGGVLILVGVVIQNTDCLLNIRYTLKFISITKISNQLYRLLDRQLLSAVRGQCLA